MTTRLAVVVLVPVLGLVPLVVRNSLSRPTAPSEQTFVYSYATGMLHTDPTDPSSPRVSLAEVLGRVPAQLGELVPSLGRRMRLAEFQAGPLVLGCAMLGFDDYWCHRYGCGHVCVGSFLL